MKRHSFLTILIVLALVACGGGDPEPSATSADAPSGTDTSASGSTGSPTSGPTDPPTGTTTPGGELYPGFDFDRVTQMAPAELPEGIPVPVPAGGVIDPSIGAFEGELLNVTYPGPYFRTAVAFYGTWLQMEQIDASPLFGFGDEVAGWEFNVGGVPVRVEITGVSGGDSAVLNVFWG